MTDADLKDIEDRANRAHLKPETRWIWQQLADEYGHGIAFFLLVGPDDVKKLVAEIRSLRVELSKLRQE